MAGAPVLRAEDMESDKCHLSGSIVRDLAAKVSNYRASQSLDEYLQAQVRCPSCSRAREALVGRACRILTQPYLFGS